MDSHNKLIKQFAKRFGNKFDAIPRQTLDLKSSENVKQTILEAEHYDLTKLINSFYELEHIEEILFNRYCLERKYDISDQVLDSYKNSLLNIYYFKNKLKKN